MSSRIAHHLDFPDYEADELLAIAGIMLEDTQYRFSPEAEQAFREYVARRMKMPHFANARSVRNALDRARLRQANRLFARPGAQLTKKDLVTLEPDDILASRVFKEGVPDTEGKDARESARRITPSRRCAGALRSDALAARHRAAAGVAQDHSRCTLQLRSIGAQTPGLSVAP